MKYCVPAEKIAPAVPACHEVDHVTGMARRLQHVDNALTEQQLVAITENSRDWTGGEAQLSRINAGAFCGAQTDGLFIARLEGARGSRGGSDRQCKTIVQTARPSGMVEMAMGQQKEGYVIQRDSIQLQVLDQSIGFDAATGIDQRELAAAIDGIDIAVAIMGQRATEKATGNEVNVIGDLQSSRSFG
jgi:hypothetical protein